ncbi:MAG: multicopper oxidase domain-containing protein [Saprospiraceae bacterium]
MIHSQSSLKLLGLFLFSCFCITGNTQNKLHIPPAEADNDFSLEILAGTREFFTGVETPTWGFNGNLLGPTLIFEKGENVVISTMNRLNEVTTIHWHGFEIPPAMDGGATAHHHIHPGEQFFSSFEILNRAGTYWYHPHPHENTEAHVVRGLAGMIIIRDEEEAALELPRTYGVDDIPLIIQDKTFDDDGLIVETGLSDTMMVNGTLNSLLDAPAQMVRFRALNASAARHYYLGWSDSTTLIQIAVGGGLLESPLPQHRIQIAPGERVEFLANFNGRAGDSLQLMSFAPEMAEGTAGQGPVFAPGLVGANSPLNGAIFPILSVAVGVQSEHPITNLPPDVLTEHTEKPKETDATHTRVLTIGSPNNGAGGPFYFNEEFYEEETINQSVPAGSIEIWEIKNNTLIGHPFHLHGGSYFLLDRNGLPPPKNEDGPKDVWFLNRGETMRIIVRAPFFVDYEVPYMYHCHMLGHEDGGLMGNWIVTDPMTVSTEEPIADFGWSVNPNPTASLVQINAQLKKATEIRLEIFSVTGKSIFNISERADIFYHKEIDLSGNPSGLYLVKLTADDLSVHQKLFLLGN